MKYYNEIDAVLKSYENYAHYHNKDMDWAANRIDWCWSGEK